MSYKLIPFPKIIKPAKGLFSFDNDLRLSSNIRLDFIPNVVKKILTTQDEGLAPDQSGYYSAVIRKSGSSMPALNPKNEQSVPRLCNREHYFIRVTPEQIRLFSADKNGMLRALATLKGIISQSKTTLRCCEIEDWADSELRGAMVCMHQVHDFMPYFGPDCRGFAAVLDVAFDAKLNCLLIEYETMFPWRGANSRISCAQAFSPDQIKSIGQEAALRGIEIIPLVQTLGHVYHILIHKEYERCQESPEYPQQLCPLKEESFKLGCELIDDLIALHPGSRFIHLGGDECRQLGVCPQCAAFAAKHGKYKLFGNFYKKVTEYVIAKRRIPIIWHDIAIKAPEVLDSLPPEVVFHFWNYGDMSHGAIAHRLKPLLSKIPPERIIGGSAARADTVYGCVMPSMAIAHRNIVEMCSVMRESHTKGTIMTDWPDSGIPFLLSLSCIIFQGEAAWNAIRPDVKKIRKCYSSVRWGVSLPDFFERLDAINGGTPFSRGFQAYLKSHLNRYEFEPYLFKNHADAFLARIMTAKNHYELYQLFQKRIIAEILIGDMEKVLPRCRLDITDLHAWLLAVKIQLAFLRLSTGTACALHTLRFPAPLAGYQLTPALIKEDLRYYLENAKQLRQELLDFYGLYSFPAHLKSYLDMLFKPEVAQGVEEILSALDANETSINSRLDSDLPA